MATSAQREQNKNELTAYYRDETSTRFAAILIGFAAEAGNAFLSEREPGLAKTAGRAGCRTIAVLSFCSFLKPDLWIGGAPKPPK